MNSGQGEPIAAGNGPDGVVAGTLAAIGAFGIWAFFPVYFNQFGPGVSPWEILLHRVIWAEVLLLGFILLSRRMDRVRAVIRRPGTMMALAGSALAIGANWATFIWAVTHSEILQSSLGYYINPLLNVFLGYCFLGTPVYFANISGQIKCFLDRAWMVARANDNMFKRKVGAAVVAARRAGAVTAFHALNTYFGISEMVIAGSTYWNMGYGREKGECLKDDEALQNMANLGKNMAWLIKSIEASKERVHA